MQTVRNICSIHQVVEVWPGVWKRARALSWPQRSRNTCKEAVCPNCLQVAQDAFQRQFPALYTSATLLTRKSAWRKSTHAGSIGAGSV